MITPIRCGVDTLEATFAGGLSDEVLEQLQDDKAKAKAYGEGVDWMLCGERLQLLPKGAGLWEYALRNDDLLIRPGTTERVPTMSVRLLAEGLASRGVDGLWSKVREIAAELGLAYQNCSRVDIALDYQGHRFTYEEMLNIRCHATFRPIYPNTINPESFYFGKGDLCARVYDKTVEILVKHKEWWVFVWRLCPGYVEGESVFRVEAQFRSKVLKELQFTSVEQILDNLPDLFAHALEWCSLRVPTADSNTRRWPEDPRWAQLRTAFSPNRELRRVRPVRSLISYDAAVRRFAHLISSLGASVGSTDYWALAKALTTDAEQLIEREMETTFPELVEKKSKRKYL